MGVPELVITLDDVVVERFVLAPLENNAWLCSWPGGGVLIDAPSDPDTLWRAAEERSITSLLITHGHADHIGAAPALAARGMSVWMGAADGRDAPWVTYRIETSQRLVIDDVTIEAICTPGHTPGSVCFAFGQSLCFTGDTLFPGGPGKTSSPQAFQTIISSISAELFARLPDPCVLLPGHGRTTTIGAERPSLPTWIERGW